MFNEINVNKDLAHYPFPSIGQFANVIYNVNHKAHYVGQDENNEPIYDKTLVKPTLKFIGTTKLHGTNAGIIIDIFNENIYFQSRENIITPVADNAGCANFLASIQTDLVTMILNTLNVEPNFYWEDKVLGIYGEWCGGSIQKGVALNQLDKMFVIFGIAIINKETKQKTWFSIEETSKYKLTDKKVFNIYDYKTYEIEINFDKHYESTNKLVEMTIEVEDMCPVSKAFGVEGIGEGIVFICITEPYIDSGFWFKSKGEKHSKSKIKVLKQVDNDKINKLIEVADKVTPSWRLEQMFNQTFDILNGGQITRNKLGDYIKAVNSDIVKEEVQTILEAGVEFKDIVTYVGKISRDYFFQMEKDMLTEK